MRVLHVDRSVFFHKIMKEIVVRCGLEYVGAVNIEEALEILLQGSVNLVITALEFEDGSGESLVTRLNEERFRKIPVFVVTSTESLEVRDHLFSLGVTDFIPKTDLTYERLSPFLKALVHQDELVAELQKLRIAVIEDSVVSTRILLAILNLYRIKQVSTFKTVEEFHAAGQDFDMYLVDLILPEQSGEKIILEIREKKPHSIIIAISGITNLKTVSQVLLLGADDYILKPFDAQLFISRLLTCLRTFLLYRSLDEKQAALQILADTDGLTGVFNHRYIMNSLKQHSGRVQILMIDLDDFKKINDSFGHDTGDDVLRSVAALLKESFAPVGKTGRYGGEEFVVDMSDVSRDAALKSIGVFMQKLRSSSLLPGGRNVSCSGGLAFGSSAGECLKGADDLLYRAKLAGKDRILND